MHEGPLLPVPDDSHARLAAEMFAMLSDPTRVKVLWALLQTELHVNALADMVGSSPTAVSRHLGKLRLAGLVTTRRDGTYIYYSAGSAHVRRLLGEALSQAEHRSGLATEITHQHSYGG